MNREILEASLQYIDQHIYEKIRLADLARLAGYSPFHFSALFSEAMGISVTTYIRIRKLQHAMKDLMAGEKVLDVALQYAFESHEGFTRAFTKLFGSTPKTVKKYLTSYTVPSYTIPREPKRSRNTRRVYAVEHTANNRKEDVQMKTPQTLWEDMHQIVFAFLRESLEEAREGHCTEIRLRLFPDNRIQVADNGRGLPLSDHSAQNQEIFSRTLAGSPVTPLDYERMEDLNSPSLQVAGSLCQTMDVTVYRNGNAYRQRYVRGIAQDALQCQASDHPSGMEVSLLPDPEIFGSLHFSPVRIAQWLEEQQKNAPALEKGTGNTACEVSISFSDAGAKTIYDKQ